MSKSSSLRTSSSSPSSLETGSGKSAAAVTDEDEQAGSIANSLTEKLRVNYTCQLHEIEALESMYSMPEEFYLHDPEAKARLEDFCGDKMGAVPLPVSEIGYDIRLQCGNAGDTGLQQAEPVEVVVSVTYPRDYPDKVSHWLFARLINWLTGYSFHCFIDCSLDWLINWLIDWLVNWLGCIDAFILTFQAPTVYVRLLNHYHTRQHQLYLNKTLSQWIKNLSKGDPCILQIFSWIEQNVVSYVSSIRPQQLSSVEDDTENNRPHNMEFERLWIYSHHIYSREKREVVVALAKNLELTGFMLIGKPGNKWWMKIVLSSSVDCSIDWWISCSFGRLIDRLVARLIDRSIDWLVAGVICVEGYRLDTRAFWEQIRRLTWQRITLKHEENITVAPSSDGLAQHQKFVKFTELTAASPVIAGKVASATHHDMGEVFRFLRDHSCDAVIPLLFGGLGGSTAAP